MRSTIEETLEATDESFKNALVQVEYFYPPINIDRDYNIHPSHKIKDENCSPWVKPVTCCCDSNPAQRFLALMALFLSFLFFLIVILVLSAFFLIKFD